MIVVRKFKLFIFQILISSSLLYCQENCDLESFYMIEEFFNEDIVAYYLSSVDINSGSSYTPLFQYSIKGNDDCYSLDSPSNINLFLDFSMDIFSPSIGFNSSQNLFKGKIKLSNISSIVTFKNMDLDYSTISVPGAEFSLISWEGVEIGDPAFELIKSSILSSGKVPNGLYSFKFSLITENDYIVDEINKTINVNEPEFIDLISPGGSVSDTSSNIVYSTFPIFTWNRDVCSSCETQIRVSEFNPNNHSSPIDAINDVSNLPNSIGGEYYSINDNLNSFQYPTSNSKSLEPGKLYAWQLRRTYQSTMGAEEIFSNIYIFKVFDGYNQINNNLDIIKLLIGENKYNEFFSNGGVLFGYNQLNENITLNGSEISISELNQIINQVQSGLINIESISVE